MKDFASRRANSRRKTLIVLTVSSVTSANQLERDCRKAKFIGHDIGAGGIGIETLFFLDIGDLLEMRIQVPGVPKPIPAAAVVRNMRSEKRGAHAVYLAGLEFVRISPEDRKRIADYAKDLGFLI